MLTDASALAMILVVCAVVGLLATAVRKDVSFAPGGARSASPAPSNS
ncbi:hypothetical protein ACFQI7_23400 [Paenibacillus allorhizosphaerae]|nr:hypothetical protein [Paenibacillus allorhizosphaerae]